jgi:hypothetical protein
MKTNSLVFLLLLLIVASEARSQPTALKMLGLTGKVKSVEEKSVELSIVNGKEKKTYDGTARTIYFDRNGRMTSEISVSSYGTSEIRYDYDEAGVRKAVKETRRPFAKPTDAVLPSVFGSVFRYDKETNSLSEDTYTSVNQRGPVYELNDLGQRFKYYFDDSERMVKKFVLEPNGNEVAVTEFYYRGDGPPAQEVMTVHKRAIETKKFEYEFDGSGNWIKSVADVETLYPKAIRYKWVTTRKIDYYAK